MQLQRHIIGSYDNLNNITQNDLRQHVSTTFQIIRLLLYFV